MHPAHSPSFYIQCRTAPKEKKKKDHHNLSVGDKNPLGRLREMKKASSPTLSVIEFIFVLKCREQFINFVEILSSIKALKRRRPDLRTLPI